MQGSLWFAAVVTVAGVVAARWIMYRIERRQRRALSLRLRQQCRRAVTIVRNDEYARGGAS